jgi:hypothetical protein
VDIIKKAKIKLVLIDNYVDTNTLASHYDWAMKKLKAHQKNCKNE